MTCKPKPMMAVQIRYSGIDGLLDAANTFGTFRQNTYDARQIEFVMKLRF